MANQEIIVINDDINSSQTSETPSEDPLAIEDFSLTQIKKSYSASIDDSTNDDASTSTDIVWLAMNTTNANKNLTLNTEKDSCDTNRNSTLPATTLEIPQRSTQKFSDTTDSLIGPTNSVHNNDELPSDNSDSGLGTEIIICNAEGACGSIKIPLFKNYEDNFANNDNNFSLSSLKSPTVLRSSLKRRFNDTNAETNKVEEKKEKRSINFDTVKVYYFPRQQGFGCVPSSGGCTLGMGAQHTSCETLTLAEYAAQIRRAHRLHLQEINPRASSEDETEESEEDYLSEGSGSDLDGDTNGFLQPVSPRQRRSILKAAGVRKIDASEKKDCRDIRNSRENCGCSCRDFCDPETCACNQAGIKCQVDRLMFPCGCSRDACGNTVGRVEFNPSRVRTHFIHTIMRLEMEKRPQQSPNNGLGYGLQVNSTHGLNSPTHQLTNNYYMSNMHTQSNYSSGYASPAYNSNEPTSNYYATQQDHQQLTGTHYNNVNNTTAHFALDSLDSNLFTGAANATPAYGELLPAYGNISTAPTSHTGYYNMNYTNVNNVLQSQVSDYASYHLPTATNYLTQNHHNSVTANYSSCAVPSEPPFGTATTTTTTTQYHAVSALSLDTTATNSCNSIEASANNFINVSAAVASSSSRLSQINDLIQHNRNATVALAEVTENASRNCLSTNTLLANKPTTITINDSIDTPPIEDVQKNYAVFEELQPPLIVAVIEDKRNERKAQIGCFDMSDIGAKHCTAVDVINTAQVNVNDAHGPSTLANSTAAVIVDLTENAKDLENANEIVEKSDKRVNMQTTIGNNKKLKVAANIAEIENVVVDKTKIVGCVQDVSEQIIVEEEYIDLPKWQKNNKNAELTAQAANNVEIHKNAEIVVTIADNNMLTTDVEIVDTAAVTYEHMKMVSKAATAVECQFNKNAAANINEHNNSNTNVKSVVASTSASASAAVNAANTNHANIINIIDNVDSNKCSNNVNTNELVVSAAQAQFIENVAVVADAADVADVDTSAVSVFKTDVNAKNAENNENIVAINIETTEAEPVVDNNTNVIVIQ